jgi:hypothetical protein
VTVARRKTETEKKRGKGMKIKRGEGSVTEAEMMMTRADAEDVMGQESAAGGGMVIVEGRGKGILGEKGKGVLEEKEKGKRTLAGTVMSTGIDIEIQTVRARVTARLQ